MPSVLQNSFRSIKLWWHIRLGNSPYPSEKGVKLPALWIDILRLAGVFLGILIITGILLSFNYEPSARPLTKNDAPVAMARALKTVVVNSDTLCVANEVLLLPMRTTDSIQFLPSELANIQIMRDEQGQILTVSAATASIEHGIMQQIPFGAVIRGVHILSVHCFIGCLVIGFILLFFRRGYRAPLELVWLHTLGIIAISLFSAFSGHILPWNILGYVSAQIVLSAVSNLPFGETFGEILRGGRTLQPATIPRIYILHILVSPIIIIVMFRSILRLSKKLVDVSSTAKFSYFAKGDIVIIILSIGATIIVPFGKYYERLPADLSKAISGTAILRPSWYFLPEFQILRIFTTDLAAFFLLVWCVFWVLLPFIGISSNRKRVAMWISGATLLIIAAGFGIVGLFR
ncbi:MAG: cytochrome b N-terminal domain-containing protein [Ignavibacteriae bacterium]|nr:cytochrome b N-terminal domain-containing protein [Ignavibacteriota bacterium]